MTDLAQVLAELVRRNKPFEIISELFEEQLAVATSSKRKRAILTSRRAGKSWVICSIMIALCLKTPEARCLYLALTAKNVKRIAFDIITQICAAHEILVKPNKVELTFEFENGSKIELAGADSTKWETERFLGAAFDAVAIDEAGSFDPEVIDYLIDTVLWPALIDRQGILILAGTPREIESGRFYEVTTAEPDEWDVFKWNTYQNIHIQKQWEEEIEDMKKANPNIEEEPWFIRDYKGQWCKDTRTQVYKFNENLNLISFIPEGSWTYVMGMDIGWNDACAFVIGGIRQYDQTFYIFESFKKTEMLPDQIAKQLKHYQSQYSPITIVGDPENKTVLKELEIRYHIPIIPAERQNKYDWVEVMNSDFVLNRIKILQAANAEYVKELSELPWKPTRTGREEHPAFDNHLCDAGLYAFRYCYNYLQGPEPKKESEEDRLYRLAVEKAKRKKQKKWWER